MTGWQEEQQRLHEHLRRDLLQELQVRLAGCSGLVTVIPLVLSLYKRQWLTKQHLSS